MNVGLGIDIPPIPNTIREESKKKQDYLVTSIKKVGRYLAEITTS